jgi:glycosyltransferase involved in cell wall biosynthesis
MPTTNVICVVPVKNESWVLNHFIEAARSWADFVIVLDDDSTDGSADIARHYDSVKVISRRNPPFDENLRRRMLIDEARQIPGKRLIFDLDADEMISANSRGSSEWKLMLDAPPGTTFHFDWLELLPGLEQCAVFDKAVAFIDDGSEFRGLKKDSPKIPATTGKAIKLKDIKLLHYIHLDPQRMLSRHRWYKCFEYMENGKRPWEVCVRYQDTTIKTYNAPVIPIRQEWISGFRWLDAYRSRKANAQRVYWWDEEVIKYFDKYGTNTFRRLNIWDVDWNQKAGLLGRTGNYEDPRSRFEVCVHSYIAKHREELKLRTSSASRLVNRFARSVLGRLDW